MNMESLKQNLLIGLKRIILILIIFQLKMPLNDYFLGNVPLTYPQFHLNGTDFQQKVWQQLRQIPYGTTVTYGQLAQRTNSSPRAVGNAVGKNPVLLFIPCHRVLGQNGKLTGYSGGLERKKKLLAIENIKL